MTEHTTAHDERTPEGGRAAPSGHGAGPESPLVVTLPGVLAVATIVVSSIALADRLPAEVASRWGADGSVVDTVALWALTVIMAATTGLVAGLLGAVRTRIGPVGAQRAVGGLAIGLPLGLAAIHVGTLVAGVEGGADAAFPRTASLVAAGLVLLGVGLGWVLVRPVEREPEVLDAPTFVVEPGEAVVWTGRAVGPAWLFGVLAAAALVAVPLAAAATPWLALVVLAVVALALSLMVARVTVGPAGLSIGLGPFGLVRLRVPITAIVSADVIDVDPLGVGGWGLRLLPGLRAVVFRSGPGLRVEQADGPTTVVTVDRAAEAAGVLRAHLAARRSATG